jgi:hypothetical protein
VTRNSAGNYTVSWQKGQFTGATMPFVTPYFTAQPPNIASLVLATDGSGSFTVDFSGHDIPFAVLVVQE